MPAPGNERIGVEIGDNKFDALALPEASIDRFVRSNDDQA